MLNRNTVFKLVASAVLATALPLSSAADDVTIKVKKRYLNLPVSHSQERGVMQLSVGGDAVRSFKIRLAPENPDYWVFCDISEFKGRKLTISYPGTNPGLKAVYQADEFAGQDSLDHGRTWTKYEGNPVINSKEYWNSRDTRDPNVFRHEASGKWVLVLNERDGHSIYNSDDLKHWTWQSHVSGFWECPDLVELPVDGNPENTKWVMYGASGTYMIGSFDGRTFTPESGKYYYTRGFDFWGNNIKVKALEIYTIKSIWD